MEEEGGSRPQARHLAGSSCLTEMLFKAPKYILPNSKDPKSEPLISEFGMYSFSPV